jgi:hypothetical protein
VVGRQAAHRISACRSPCIRGFRVRAPQPAKVLSSPDTSVWGPLVWLRVSQFDTCVDIGVLSSFPYGIAWKFPTVGGPCAVAWSMPCLGMADF